MDIAGARHRPGKYFFILKFNKNMKVFLLAGCLCIRHLAYHAR